MMIIGFYIMLIKKGNDDLKGIYKCRCGRILEINIVGSKIILKVIEGGKYVSR